MTYEAKSSRKIVFFIFNVVYKTDQGNYKLKTCESWVLHKKIGCFHIDFMDIRVAEKICLDSCIQCENLKIFLPLRFYVQFLAPKIDFT